MSEGRYAWVRTILGQFQIMRYNNNPDEETGDTIVLFIPRPGTKPVQMNITSLTWEELDTTRRFFNLMFDLAEPVCRERDKVARDAFEQGDDTYTRSYRQAPQFIVREGAVASYPESVFGGPEDVPAGHGQDGGDSGGVREPGDELADEESSDRRPQDDQPPADEPESVREVGQVG
jgi:hypothetical protein